MTPISASGAYKGGAYKKKSVYLIYVIAKLYFLDFLEEYWEFSKIEKRVPRYDQYKASYQIVEISDHWGTQTQRYFGPNFNFFVLKTLNIQDT